MRRSTSRIDSTYSSNFASIGRACPLLQLCKSSCYSIQEAAIRSLSSCRGTGIYFSAIPEEPFKYTSWVHFEGKGLLVHSQQTPPDGPSSWPHNSSEANWVSFPSTWAAS